MAGPIKARSTKSRIALLCGAILVVGLGAGYAIGYSRATQMIGDEIRTIQPVRENNTSYRFIFPLLFYQFNDVKPFFEDKSLETAIWGFIQPQEAAGNAQSISVSVRELPRNQWAGVNDTVQYQPGSMLKVLIMMAYFREAELKPEILQGQLTYTAAANQRTNSLSFDLPTRLSVGASYPIENLLKTMIANSDNGAEELLAENINRTILNQVYVDLGIPNPDTTTSTYTLSPDQYMDFLRILYNSTYLSEQYSEESLSIMSQSTYRDGIVAGVPAGVTVAQKYGERVDASGNTVQAVELHDCGIVYPDKHPYAICIMTKGSDVNKLTAILRGISSLVYQYEVP